MNSYKHLMQDARLAPVVKQHGPLQLNPGKNLFNNLVASIISQQLSTKVARIIYGRFVGLTGNRFKPEDVMELNAEALRNIGLSNAKASYVKNVAQFAMAEGLQTRKLNKLDNDEVIAYLTRIKGVGRWTAQMELMFTLGREDVFPVDDLGIRQAMTSLYQIRGKDLKKINEKMLRISLGWSPYRTYACMYLWRFKDAQKTNP